MKINPPKIGTAGVIVGGVTAAVELFCGILSYIGMRKAEKIREDDIDKIAEKVVLKLAEKVEIESTEEHE